jgi:hypothetical protein
MYRKRKNFWSEPDRHHASISMIRKNTWSVELKFASKVLSEKPVLHTTFLFWYIMENLFDFWLTKILWFQPTVSAMWSIYLRSCNLLEREYYVQLQSSESVSTKLHISRLWLGIGLERCSSIMSTYTWLCSAGLLGFFISSPFLIPFLASHRC